MHNVLSNGILYNVFVLCYKNQDGSGDPSKKKKKDDREGPSKKKKKDDSEDPSKKKNSPGKV